MAICPVENIACMWKSKVCNQNVGLCSESMRKSYFVPDRTKQKRRIIKTVVLPLPNIAQPRSHYVDASTAGFCVKGCGKPVAPGLTKNGNPYKTCCRGNRIRLFE